MTGGMGRGGFFAGALGGLAMALLLVGVASLVPQTNPAMQAASTSSLNVAQGAASTTTTAAFSSAGSAMTSVAAPSATTVSSTTTVVTSSAAPPSAGVTKTATVTTTVAGPSSAASVVDQGGQSVVSTATTTVAGVASGSVSYQAGGNGPSPAASGANAAEGRPSSLLAALPGEGVGALLGTLSPLLIGLLVAVLIYGVYSRQQDVSS